jgi:hypothetical protein
MFSLEGRAGGQSHYSTESDLWFTPMNVKEAYEEVVNETNSWRKGVEEAKNKPKSSFAKLKSVIDRGKKEEIFVVREAIAPRLYKLADGRAGLVYFEFTEVEEGGTVVKATYNTGSKDNPSVKDRIAGFKARSSLIIPKTPVASQCPSCGKSVLREFKICPYCGQKLVSW